MKTVPRDPAALSAWLASLSETESVAVYQAFLAAIELHALAAASTIPVAPIAATLQPAPQRGTIHPYFGWREAKKWILVGIARRGGSAPTAEIIDFVYDNIRDELLPEDLEPTDETPEPRWRNRVRWERENLADQGYIRRGLPRGVWTLTEKGRHLLGLR